MQFKLILLPIILIGNLSFCQKTEQESMIKQFIKDLFNASIPAKIIVNTYLEILPDKKNSNTLDKRKNFAEQLIEKTRNKENNDNGWITPTNKIKNLKKIELYPYYKYKNLSNLNISGIKRVENRVYVLLDPKKEKIWQYFLLNEKGNKILSFSMFVKGDVAWFFGF